MNRRFSEERIIGVLREQDAGGTVTEITRRHGVSEQSFYRWKAKYAGLKVRELALDDWAYRNRVRLAALGPGLPDTRGIRFTPSRACPGWHETKRKSSAILSTQTIKPSDRFLGHVKERPLKWLVAGTRNCLNLLLFIKGVEIGRAASYRDEHPIGKPIPPRHSRRREKRSA